MKARLRTCLAALLCFAGSPALAQQTPANDVAPAQNGVVGPVQLQNFSINGTVTRAAPPPLAESTPAARTASSPPSEPRRTDKPVATPPRQVDQPAPREKSSQAMSGTVQAPTLPPQVAAPSPKTGDTVSADAPPPPITAPSAPSNTVPMLAWIVAGFAIAGAAAWLLLRRTRRESFAGDADDDLFEAPAAAVAEPEAPPAAPAAPLPAGIVSTRLRPWLEIELRPDRGVVDDEKAAVAFDLTVTNSGSAPARDVILEATLFNAGPAQDQQIQMFFDKPVGRGDPIPAIPPMKSVTVSTAVFIARDKVQPIEIEGRQLFVPMIAVNALYSWGSAKGQSSASYLIGKETSGKKLAPFRTDVGRRIFRGLAARQHALNVRR